MWLNTDTGEQYLWSPCIGVLSCGAHHLDAAHLATTIDRSSCVYREVRAAAVTAVGQLAEKPGHLATFAGQQATSAALQECVAALGDALLDSAHAVCQSACAAVRCGLHSSCPGGI